MRIREVENGSVLVELDPGDCLLFAEACGAKAEDLSMVPERQEAALYYQMAGYCEALALLGSVSNYVCDYKMVLAEWTLPIVRKDWGTVPTRQEVAK